MNIVVKFDEETGKASEVTADPLSLEGLAVAVNRGGGLDAWAAGIVADAVAKAKAKPASTPKDAPHKK